MDPQQADPSQPQPPQPAHDLTGQYTPMRNTGLPEPAEGDGNYSDQQAVDWARSKIAALHKNQPEPSPVQQLVDQPANAGPAVDSAQTPAQAQTWPSVEYGTPAPPPTEPAVPIQPKAANASFMPKQEFATFELPEETAEVLEPPVETVPTGQTAPAAEDIDLGNRYDPMENQGNPVTEVAAPLGHVATAPVMEAVATPTTQGTGVDIPAAEPKPTGSLIDKIKQFYSGRPKLPSKFKPLVTSALIGLGIYFLFNSQVLIGQIQYLTNSGTDTSASAVDITSDETVPPDPVIIIPKINVNVPVVYDVATYDESAIQQALERGVVHYHNTALPGQIGNNVIVGHSSNNWWASGQYKFAFVLLNKLEVGDTFVIHYNSKKYIYEVSGKKIVEPNDLSVVQPTPEPTATLITCDPPGTALRRLVVTAKQISPNPAQASQANTPQPQQDLNQLPSNSPSLWQQIQRRVFGD